CLGGSFGTKLLFQMTGNATHAIVVTATVGVFDAHGGKEVSSRRRWEKLAKVDWYGATIGHALSHRLGCCTERFKKHRGQINCRRNTFTVSQCKNRFCRYGQFNEPGAVIRGTCAFNSVGTFEICRFSSFWLPQIRFSRVGLPGLPWTLFTVMFGPKLFREAIACQFLYKGRLLVFRASFRRLWIVALQIGCDHIGEKPQCTGAIGQRAKYF